MTTLVARPEEIRRHKKSLGSHRGSTTQKGGTAMNSASVANRPVDRPPKSDHPKKGPWAVGHESDERIAIIADALNLFDDGPSRSATDTAVRRPSHDTVTRIVRAFRRRGLSGITAEQLFPVDEEALAS